MRRGKNQTQRRGNVLVYFALITFVMFAMAALTIDMGFVRMTQAQMQPAVESAALEGLRFRDHIPDSWVSDPASPFLAAVQPECGPRPALPQYLTDPAWVAWRENVRRWLARNQAALMYANRLSPGNDVPNLPMFGAGPVYALGTGVGPSNALQTISAGMPPVYQPHLELNLATNATGNANNGDLVAGTFGPNSNYPADDMKDENKDYDRRDFIPASPSQAGTAPSFLARLRRVNDFEAQSGLESQPGISSHGPQMPLLFGRGTLIAGADPNSGYSLRHHGLSVRATAIADGRPVVSVGRLSTSASFSVPGRTPFVLFRSAWTDGTVLPSDATDVNSANPNPPVQITLQGDGSLKINSTLVGHFTSIEPAALISLGQPTSAIGTDPTVSQLMNALTDPAYVPIIEDPTSGTVIGGTIIGFGFLTVDFTSITPTGFQIRKRAGKIAPTNASTVLMQPLPLLFSSSGNEANLLLLLNRWRQLVDPLLAPTLVR